MTGEKDERHEKNEGEHVEADSYPIEDGTHGSPVHTEVKQAGTDGEDAGVDGKQHVQQHSEVPVESTLASINRYDGEGEIISEARRRILMPGTSIVMPGSGIYQHLTEHDGIQRVLEMAMKYADVGIKYPVGPRFIQENACIIDRKVMLYIVPLATVTEIEVWFVAKEQCLVRGVFTLELLDNETLAELEGEFVQHIALYVQNRRLH